MVKNAPIEEAATGWLLRKEAPDWGEADERALKAWLEESTLHTVAYLRLEAAWRETSRLKALTAGVPRGTVPTGEDWQFRLAFDERRVRPSVVEELAAGTASASSKPHRRWPRALNWRGALVAGLLLAILAGGLRLWIFTGSTYQTPVGGTASIPLSDGSEVTLNTNSRIQVHFEEHERTVHLEHGEAFFEVAKDPARPFVVIAGDQRVVAVGTEFSVMRIGDQVRVTVTEGTVRLDDGAGQGAGANKSQAQEAHDKRAPAIPEGLAGDGVLLPAGSLARVRGGSILLETKPVSEVEESLSWRTGYLIFRDTSLSEAVTEFNRYNARHLVIDDASVGEIRVSGKFRATNYEAFVRLIEEGFPINARPAEDDILLEHR